MAAVVVALVAVVGAAAAAAPRVTGITGGDRITTFAGHAKFGLGGFSGDGGPAAKAELSQPAGVAVDGKGNVYIADSRNQRIRKVSPAGTITTIAGGGPGFSAGQTSGPALTASLGNPTGVAVDGQGNVYIADSQHVYRVSPAGTLTFFAGIGGSQDPAYLGDGGQASAAQVFPYGVAVDGRGNVYIADNGNRRVRKVNPAGIITTIAGNGQPGSAGDGGPATAAQLTTPHGVAVDGRGNVYVADQFAGRVRKVIPGGTITTIAGNGKAGFGPDGVAATKSSVLNISGVAVDAQGNVYLAEEFRVRKVTPSGTITTVAGLGARQTSQGPGDGGPATSGAVRRAVGLAFDKKRNLYIGDLGNAAVRKVWYGTARKKSKK